MLRLIFLLLFSYSVNASDPTFTVGTDPIIDISQTGTALNLNDDAVSSSQNLGFDFTYYGNTYNQVKVAMNGFVTFNQNFNITGRRNYLSEVIPASGYDNTIFPLWSDFIDKNNNNGSPFVQTFGSSGSKYWVAGWYDVNEYRNNNLSSFEAILYESTNIIEFRYKKINVTNHSITIGLQGNNEAITYLRYLDDNTKTYNRTDEWSLSTGIDESYSNLSTECLTNSNYSALCDVYDLGSDSEEDDILDFIDNLLSNDTEDYGYSTFDGTDDDIYLGFDTINYETGEGLATDIYIIDIEEDITLFELEEELDFENNIFIEPDYVDVIDVVGNDNERPLDILELPTVDLLPDIYPEDNYIEIAEVLELEEMPEEIIEELEKELEEIVFEEIFEEPIEELEEIDEIDEPEERQNNVRRNVVSTNNYYWFFYFYN